MDVELNIDSKEVVYDTRKRQAVAKPESLTTGRRVGVMWQSLVGS